MPIWTSLEVSFTHISVNLTSFMGIPNSEQTSWEIYA